MKSRDELFQEYEETLTHIDKVANDARELAREKLKIRLKSLREECHKELKAIRSIDQKIKRSVI